MKFKEHKIEYIISVKDFEHAFNRYPESQDEWENFKHYCEKGLEAQIDWGIIIEEAKDNMEL